MEETENRPLKRKDLEMEIHAMKRNAIARDKVSRFDGARGEDDANDASNRVLSQAQMDVQEQQSRGDAICWERFLRFTSIRVLVVENDDSTRQIVTALLMNCNYEVIEAANGLEAWKILEDVTNQIDLVLSEVVIPCLSGLDLLCKITSHKHCSNIPVIMMSSHDSVGFVFKCLLKGAVDFLVKPVRKNELKNLWQHVWRRYHSTSGSGSRSGAETKNSEESKNSKKSGKNSGSNVGKDNRNYDLKIGGGSDEGSGMQVQ